MAADSAQVPIDLFYHICENLPKDALANVAVANSSFQNVSEKLIYRRLRLTSVPQALQCCQTIVKKQSAAQAVREFVVMIKYVLLVIRFKACLLMRRGNLLVVLLLV